jgi:hypothetical protein
MLVGGENEWILQPNVERHCQDFGERVSEVLLLEAAMHFVAQGHAVVLGPPREHAAHKAAKAAWYQVQDPLLVMEDLRPVIEVEVLDLLGRQWSPFLFGVANIAAISAPVLVPAIKSK